MAKRKQTPKKNAKENDWDETLDASDSASDEDIDENIDEVQNEDVLPDTEWKDEPSHRRIGADRRRTFWFRDVQDLVDDPGQNVSPRNW